MRLLLNSEGSPHLLILSRYVFDGRRLRVLGSLNPFSSHSSDPASFIFIESGKILLYLKTYKEFTPHFKIQKSLIFVRHIGILSLVIEAVVSAVVRRLPWKEFYDLSPSLPTQVNFGGNVDVFACRIGSGRAAIADYLEFVDEKINKEKFKNHGELISTEGLRNRE